MRRACGAVYIFNCEQGLSASFRGVVWGIASILPRTGEADNAGHQIHGPQRRLLNLWRPAINRLSDLWSKICTGHRGDCAFVPALPVD